MNPVRVSLRYPQVTLILTLMLFGVGVHALLTMPRREDPKITIRTGLVSAVYPATTSLNRESISLSSPFSITLFILEISAGMRSGARTSGLWTMARTILAC